MTPVSDRQCTYTGLSEMLTPDLTRCSSTVIISSGTCSVWRNTKLVGRRSWAVVWPRPRWMSEYLLRFLWFVWH